MRWRQRVVKPHYFSETEQANYNCNKRGETAEEYLEEFHASHSLLKTGHSQCTACLQIAGCYRCIWGGRDKERWYLFSATVNYNSPEGTPKQLNNSKIIWNPKAKLNGPERYYFHKSASVCFLLSLHSSVPLAQWWDINSELCKSTVQSDQLRHSKSKSEKIIASDYALKSLA